MKKGEKQLARGAGVTKSGRMAPLVADIRRLIESARERAAAFVNIELTMLYWRIGKRVHDEILKGKRAQYGEEIVTMLSAELTADYGRGFDVKNLWRMVQFVGCFSDEKIIVTLSRQLSWSHFVAILPVDDPLARVLARVESKRRSLELHKNQTAGRKTDERQKRTSLKSAQSLTLSAKES